jgi:hypothetical protein
VSQFSQLYTAATAEAVATIADTLTFDGADYPCVLSEETYGNALADGGFEPLREIRATVKSADAPTFAIGRRVTVNGREFRISGIDTDAASIDLRLQAPDQR